MNLDELLKDNPQRPQHRYYPKNECCDELVLIENGECGEFQGSGSEWTTQTTLWVMAFAVLLWLITYILVMTITICFDFSFRSVASFNRLIQCINGTTVMTNNDPTTRFMISY